MIDNVIGLFAIAIGRWVGELEEGCLVVLAVGVVGCIFWGVVDG
jgi:hypothetical protein